MHMYYDAGLCNLLIKDKNNLDISTTSRPLNSLEVRGSIFIHLLLRTLHMFRLHYYKA